MFLKIATLNVRGLLEQGKFEKLKLLCSRSNVLVVQETNWRDEVMESFKKKWKGDIFYSNGDGRLGRGVAFLIKKGVCEKAQVVYDDMQGKCLIVKMIEGETNIILCNVHAPVVEKEKVLFFKKLKDIIVKWENILIMGDFNTTFSKMDIADGMVFKSDSGRKELKSLMEEKNLVDVWRERNEGIREFSRQQVVKNFICRSRIDFLISKREMLKLIDTIFYKETVLSDHKVVCIQVDMNDVKRGPGIWMLNTEILKDENFKEQIEVLIKKEQGNLMYKDEKRIWWDNLKYDIGKCAREYSKIIQKIKKRKEKEIRIELRDELSKEVVNLQKTVMLEEKLKEIEDKKYKGAMIRSKAKYLVEGEKCTRFFFNMEKNRQRAGMIKELIGKGGGKVKEKEEVLKEIKDYYESLFKREGVGREEIEFLVGKIKIKIDNGDKNLCERGIEKEEIEEAIMQLNNGKSPGKDGLPNEFYKVFRKVLTPILKDVYDEIFKKEETSYFMGIGLVKLIYKRKGDIADLKNYRPITMLNTDFKILSKILANRLKKILPNIIQTNQAYAIPGRDITDTISSIRDVVSYMITEKKSGYVISLDLEKAFDRVEHEYLFRILQQFGFGDNFIKWLKILYKDSKSQVKCNGFITETFKLTRSIRQGCPLSALLYSLVAEALGLAITEEKEIRGIDTEENRELQKVYQYADDTTIIVQDVASVVKAMDIIEKYCKGSGAKINKQKTVIMSIGKIEKIQKFYPFKEQESLKILGVRIGKNEKMVRDLMWEEVVGEMERVLNYWKQRDLTLRGKVLVINALMLAKMWYVLGVIPMPMGISKRLKKDVLNFLWGSKPSKISYNTLIGAIEEGGLGLQDPELKKKSFRVKTVKTFLNEENKAEWKILMRMFLNKCGHMKIGPDILWMKLKPKMITGIPEFYKEVLEAWTEFLPNVCIKPIRRLEFLMQPLFLNENIVYRGKELFFKHWINAGFKTIRDVLYEVREGFLPVQAIYDEVKNIENHVNRNALKKQYDQIKEAIPKEWIINIEKQGKDSEEDKMKVFLKAKGDKEPFYLSHIRTFYVLFRNSVFKEPAGNKFWKKVFIKLEEEDLWRNLRKWHIDVKMENLDFYIRHNIIFSEEKLYKCGMTGDALCKVCCEKNEGILHMFLSCKELIIFRDKMKNLIKSLLGDKMDVIEDEQSWNCVFLFGMNEKSDNQNVINLFLIVARYAIWCRRNVAREKNKKLGLWIYFKKKLEDYIRTLESYFNAEGKMYVFDKLILNNNPYVLKTLNGLKINV